MIKKILGLEQEKIFVFTWKDLRSCLGVVFALILFNTIPLMNVQAATPDEEKIGVGVNETIRLKGKAYVVIALKEPSAVHASQINMPTLKREIATMQESVLSELYALDYSERHRYQAIPALAGTVTETGLAKLVTNDNVVMIDLDVGGTGALATSVSLINAHKQHARGITGEGTVVAVLDTGLDTDHTDLADDLIHQECFLDFDGTINAVGRCPNGSDRQSGAGAAEDGRGHGTHVTGIISSRGTVSSVGVAPDASIVAIKVLDDSGHSGTFEFFSEIVAALDFIINNRPDVDVINMSLGTFGLFAGDCDNTTSFNRAGAAAINTLRANGVIAFASSANNRSGTMLASPGCLSNVVSVGATDRNDNVAGFTNSNTSLDIMAPGVGIVSTGLANGTTINSGTSMASPHAAGCAALFIDAGIATTPDEIEALLETSPVKVTDLTNGLSFPRIDCGRASGDPSSDQLWIEKLINHNVRLAADTAAELLVGTRYRVDYKVTNNSPVRLYNVRVIEDDELVCNLYALNPGESMQPSRCATNQDVLVGLNNVPASVTAKVSGTNEKLINRTNAYYMGFDDIPGKLSVTHYLNDRNADIQANAVTLNSARAEILFRVENTGSIKLYRVKMYHDPVSPIDSGWQEKCFFGTLMPGQVRYCKRTINVTQLGLNKVFGRAQAEDANVSPIDFVNAANPTYFKRVLP